MNTNQKRAWEEALWIIYVVFWCRVEVPAGGRREMKADADIMVRTVEACECCELCVVRLCEALKGRRVRWKYL